MKLRTAKIWSLRNLIDTAQTIQGNFDGRWVPARPLGLTGRFLIYRLKCAWLAFVGKCDLVRWPEGQ
jgi:hypothetical protein